MATKLSELLQLLAPEQIIIVCKHNNLIITEQTAFEILHPLLTRIKDSEIYEKEVIKIKAKKDKLIIRVDSL